MSKIAHYLQEHLLGEVTASPEIRRHFAHDASILQLVPAMVVYPANEYDVRKSVRFAWQLAERGRILPVTARGGGSGTSGAAIGNGILMVFPAHMDKLLLLNTKKRTIAVEPGVIYGALEQTLNSHGLTLPVYPASKDYATLGGAIASNAIGEKSVKYGETSNFVRSLRVVLSNGEVIETGPLSNKELNRKLGQQSLEGEIYRSLDNLLEENAELIAHGHDRIKSRHNSAGYNLFDIKKHNEFDLTPLLIGSQGTLGIITEAALDVTSRNPKTTTALVSLDKLDDLQEILANILRLNPSMLDMLNRAAAEQVSDLNPSQLTSILSRPAAAIHLFLGFDDAKESEQKKKLKSLEKIVSKFGVWSEIFEGYEEQERFWKFRGSVSTILIQSHKRAKAIPVAEDVCIPVEKLAEYIHKAKQLYKSVGLPCVAWGYAGSGVVRTQPALDLSQIGDRQKLFKIQDSLYGAAVEMGGSISAGSGDGRIRAPYLALQYGEEFYNLMLKVKKIFDPHGILNPGVKTATQDDIKKLLRNEYSLGHLQAYLPRS